MLLAVRQLGRVKATKILDSCRISPSKTFGGLRLLSEVRSGNGKQPWRKL